MSKAIHANTLSRTQQIGLASVVLLLLTVSLGLFLGMQTRAQFREIEASWADYTDGVERKSAWISSSRGYLGYGGIIHNFKNYVLRQDAVYLDRTREQIARFMATTSEYLDATTDPEERKAIAAIRETIEHYDAALPTAVQAAEENWDVAQTDAAVRVADKKAIEALAVLEQLLIVNRQISADRMLAAVSRGQTLIWIGFGSIAALVMSSLLIGILLILLLRDMRDAMSRLSDELVKRRKLQQSNERLARAVEQSPTTIFMTDTDAQIIYANRQFERLTGWNREEVIGQTPRFLQSGDTPPAEYDAIRERLAKGQDWQGTFRNRCKDGSSYWAETKILPLVASDGTIQNYIGIGEDVTEKRQAREHVARAQKLEAVGLLAGGIAHDFNNILTTIVGSAHLAGLDAPEGSDIAVEIEQIDIAARRAQSLVRGLLTFARRAPGVARPNDLDVIIDEVSRLLRASMPPTITLDCTGVARQLFVLGDETHLHQIVMNLCRNAIEAIGGSVGVIRVAAHKLGDDLPEGLPPHPEGWVRFEVSDDGPGMSAETRQNLFDPFFTTKPLGKGSGLGLAVVFRLVEEMKGTIDVASQPGQGACFTICLPGAVQGAAQMKPQKQEIPRGHERIVLVDDEAEIATTFRRVLLRLGYQVDAFTSPLAALEHVRAAPDRPDLIISDMVMPQMNGETLVNAVRGLRPQIPVIFCTGYNPSGLKVDGPPPELMNKPVDPDKLARLIRSMIDAAI
jgi:PAS domain S-box-containing protein